MPDGPLLSNISNRAVLIICMIFAALFWFLNRMGEEYRTEIRVPIKYEKSDSMTFTSAPSESVIYIVNSQGWNLLGASKSQMEKDSIRVRLDNSQHQVIPQTQLIRQVNENVLKKFEIIDTRPQMLEINQELAQYKHVPVRIPLALEYRENYHQAGNLKLNPDSVWVIGPFSDVNNISYWTSDSVSLKDLHKDISQSIKLAKPLSRTIRLDADEVKLEIPVEQFTENTLYVPIEIVNLESDSIVIFPTRTRLKFKVPISKYDHISRDDFKAYVDESGPRISDNKLLIHVTTNNKLVRDLDFEPKLVEFFTKSD